MTVFPILSLTHWLQFFLPNMDLICPLNLRASVEKSTFRLHKLVVRLEKASYRWMQYVIVKSAWAVLMTTSIGHKFEDMQKATNP